MAAPKISKTNNLVPFEYVVRKQEKRGEEDYVFRLFREFNAEVNKRAKEEAFQNADDITQKELRELKKEVEALNIRLKYSFPISLVVFLCVFLTLTLSSFCIFVFQAMSGIKYIDFYILALCFVAGLGLFITSISTIIEFRKKINVQEK